MPQVKGMARLVDAQLAKDVFNINPFDKPVGVKGIDPGPIDKNADVRIGQRGLHLLQRHAILVQQAAVLERQQALFQTFGQNSFP